MELYLHLKGKNSANVMIIFFFFVDPFDTEI